MSFRRLVHSALPRAPRGKRGIALVIVLGLLALLLITTVTFTISMRVERNAASHQRHASVARVFAKTALAQAIAAIDDDIIDNGGEVVWNDDDSSGGDDLVYPFTVSGGNTSGRSFHLLRDTLVSIDRDTDRTNDVGQVGTLATADAAAFLPPGHLYKALAKRVTKYDPDRGDYTSIRRPEWIPIKDGGGSIIGRASFMAFNTTASLNANVITNSSGNAERRKAGKNPAEIAVPSSSDTSSAAQAICAILGRGHRSWYESFLEPEVDALSSAGSGTYFESLASLVARAGGAEFSALDVFNYTVFTNFFEYIDGNGSVKREPCVNLFVADDAENASLRKIQENKKAVLLSLVNALAGRSYASLDAVDNDTEKQNAILLYNALVDYVDVDDEMSTDTCSDVLRVNGLSQSMLKYARPVSENMPLFSGIVVKMELTRKRGAVTLADPAVPGSKPKVKYSYTAKFTPEIHWMYPFLKSPCPPDLSIHYKIAVADGRGSRKTPDDWKKLLVADDGDFSWSGQFRDDWDGGDPPQGGSEGMEGEEKTKTSAACEVEIELGSNNPASPDKNAEDSLPEMKFDIVFAAQTRRNSTVLRGIPVDVAEFGSFGPNNESSYYVIHVDTKKDKDDGYDAPVFKADGCTGEDAEEKITRYYWAEVFDPAFAWHNQEGCAADDEEVRSAYRPSVDATAQGRLANDNLFKCAYKLKGEGGFGGISGHIRASGEPEFDHGLGPVAQTILESPQAARALKLNLDGISFRSNAQGDEADPLSRQYRRFVRNGNLESVGELAFLPVGPWQTLRLYDHGEYFDPDRNFPYSEIPAHNGLHYHDLLDRFSLAPPGGSQGYVDIRSAFPGSMDALKSLTFAFNRLPVAIPGKEEGARRITTPNAARLAAMLLRNAPCYRLSDLALLFDGDNYNYAPDILAQDYGQNYGEFEREALIRNSCGLFSTRGNTFTILMRAESYSPTLYYETTMGGNPNASVVAIAQIWRDTVKDADGQYPVLIQFFKILGN